MQPTMRRSFSLRDRKSVRKYRTPNPLGSNQGSCSGAWPGWERGWAQELRKNNLKSSSRKRSFRRSPVYSSKSNF